MNLTDLWTRRDGLWASAELLVDFTSHNSQIKRDEKLRNFVNSVDSVMKLSRLATNRMDNYCVNFNVISL